MTLAVVFIPLFVYAVAALVLVAGAAKLVSAASREQVPDSAVRVALGIGREPWRYIEPLVGVVETGLAACVLTGVSPVVGSVGIAACGLCFVCVLTRVRSRQIDGDCGCVRLGRPTCAAASSTAVWRAAGVGLGGIAGIVAFTSLPQSTVLVHLIALSGGIIATAAWLGLRELRARCSVPRWRLWRRGTLAALKSHPTFRAMSEAWKLEGSPYFQRSEGCQDEFRFQAPPDSMTVVTFRAVRTARGVISVHSEVRRGDVAG